MGEKKISWPCQDSDHDRQVRSLVPMPTELSRLRRLHACRHQTCNTTQHTQHTSTYRHTHTRTLTNNIHTHTHREPHEGRICAVCTCVPLRTVSDIDLLHCIIVRNRTHVLMHFFFRVSTNTMTSWDTLCTLTHLYLWSIFVYHSHGYKEFCFLGYNAA